MATAATDRNLALLKHTNTMSNKIDKWIEAKKKFKLSDKHIQMARELGLKVETHSTSTSTSTSTFLRIYFTHRGTGTIYSSGYKPTLIKDRSYILSELTSL